MTNKIGVVQSDSIHPGRSVIVVSDLHLGGTEDPHTSSRFSRFLEYVAGLYSEDRPVQPLERRLNTLPLLPPQKIILLGDFFDLWDPRCQDRNNVILDAMIPIAKLGMMDCDVVFVTGNHDEDIGELVNLQRGIEHPRKWEPCREEPDPCEKGVGSQGWETSQRPARTISYLPPQKDSHDAGMDFCIRPGRKFTIYQRAFIPGPEREGLNVHGVFYAFLHGHQFDPEQVTFRVSEFFKERFDPVGIIMDYANTGLAKSIPFWLCILFLLLWIPSAFLYSNAHDPESLAPVYGGIVFAIFALLFLHRSYLHRDIPAGQDARPMYWASLSIFASIILLLLAGRFNPSVYAGMFSFAFWVLTLIFIVISFPRIFGKAKRGFYNYVKAPNMTVEQVAGKGDREQYRYFRPQNYTLKANVVIFGHTECTGKPFLNTVPDLIEQKYPFHPESDDGLVQGGKDLLRRLKDILTKGYYHVYRVKHPLAGRKFFLINSGGWVRTYPNKEPSLFRRLATSCEVLVVELKKTLPFRNEPAVPEKPDPHKKLSLLQRLAIRCDVLAAESKRILLNGDEPPEYKKQDPCKDHLDTFVYIDADGVSLWKWVESKEEGVLCRGEVRYITGIDRDELLSRTGPAKSQA